MKQKLIISLTIVLFMGLSFMFAQHASAGGLYLSQLNSPTSLGTAGVNNVVNNISADAAYTNPAGMTGITQTTIMPGFQVLIPQVKFEANVAEAGGDNGGNAGFVSMIPGFNAVKVLSDKWRFGFAITAPLGGGVDYGDKFAGRYGATRSVLSGLGLTPSLGYKINDDVSVGFGVTAIYTVFDEDIAVDKPGPDDGYVRINQIDDWSAQGFVGLTWQVTDKAMLGVVYRTKSEVELEGDLTFEGLPLINAITGNPDHVEVDFDYAQVISIGLAYDVSDKLRLIVDADWEDWSEFSENNISVQGGEINTTLERNWDDTWHVGIAAIYKMTDSQITAGLGYDSSPVDDEDRTLDLPLDEQFKFGMAYGYKSSETRAYSIGFSYVWLGDGKIDQITQGHRVQGEFDTNYFVSIGGNARFLF